VSLSLHHVRLWHLPTPPTRAIDNMEWLISIKDTFIANKEWVLSGIGVPAVIGLLTWFFKSRNSEKNKIEISADKRSIAAQTLTISNSQIDNSEIHNHGISIDVHQRILTKRENEIRNELSALADNEKEKRILLTIGLNTVQERLSNLKKSFQENKQRLKEAEKTLIEWKDQIPSKQFDHAQKQLEQGESTAAKETFLSIANKSATDTAKAYYEAGRLAENDIRYDEAVLYLKKAALFEENNALYLNQVGILASKLGKYSDAQSYFEKSLKINLVAFGDNHSNVATDYNNLGLAWDNKGEYDKAITYFEKALKIDLVALGDNHPSVATGYNNLGSAWHNKGEHDKAITYFEKALKIDLVALGENHPSLATRYNNIGSAWHNKGEYDKAITYLEKALKTNLVALGNNHPSVATGYNNLGLTWHNKGEYDKAITYFEKALKIDLVALGDNHPSVATDYNNLGLTWDNKGEYDKAITYFEKALKINIAALGDNHPSVATGYNNLGLAWDNKRKYDKTITGYFPTKVLDTT